MAKKQRIAGAASPRFQAVRPREQKKLQHRPPQIASHALKALVEMTMDASPQAGSSDGRLPDLAV